MPVARDLALDELRDGQVAHRLARDVDLEADVVARRAGGSALRGHPLVDLLDQAEALGGVDERGGHDDLAVVADHAQQQLVLGDAVGRELEDRLAVQDEAVLVERAADLVGPVQADLHAADVLAAVAGGDVVAVAAGLLGRVHREVGADHQVLDGAAPRRRSRRCRSRWSSRCAGPRAAGGARGSSRACPRRCAPRCRGRRRAAARRTRRRRGGRPRRSCARCRAARGRPRG